MAKLISVGSLIKHKGILADGSTKVELIINELTPEDAGILNELCKGKMVNHIISDET